jgi:hypothetical protein
MRRLADGAGAFCCGRSASKLIGKTAPEHREDGRLFRLQTRKCITQLDATGFTSTLAEVFLASLFSREFAGVTGLVFKAIRGRDGWHARFRRRPL